MTSVFGLSIGIPQNVTSLLASRVDCWSGVLPLPSFGITYHDCVRT